MSKHGTAFSLGQYNEVLLAIARALPRALEGKNPKQVICDIQNGEVLERELDVMIQSLHEGIYQMSGPKFKVWKTIELGFFKNADEYRQALKTHGFEIGREAYWMLDEISVSKTGIELDLTIVSPSDLGIKDLAYSQDLTSTTYIKALDLGLKLCPAEAGPALRLAYPSQPYGEHLNIAMKPIANSIGHPSLFGVAHLVGKQQLDDTLINDNSRSLKSLWVFVLP